MPELSYCAEQARRHDRDRFLCALFAPEAEREALAALYAFNAEVARIPELVTEPLVGRMRVQWWRDAIEAVFAGRPPAHAVAGPLAEAVRRHGLGREPFDRLLDAREGDLDPEVQPPTLDALVAYAEATSSTLAALGVRVLDADGAAPAACEAGIAWALAGLVRAVPFHARMRRLMLPADLGRAAGLDAEAVFRGRPPPALAEVVRAVVAAAASHLEAARARRAEVPVHALPVMLIATLAEADIRRIAAAGYDPFAPGLARRPPAALVTLLVRRLRRRY